MTNTATTYNAQIYIKFFKTFFGFLLIFISSSTNIFAVGGDVDTTFKAGVTGYSSTNAVRDVVVQPDGRIVIVGGFTVVNGISRSRIARLNTDGSLDTSFNASLNGEGQTIVLLPDGKMYIGGGFSVVNGVARSYIVRLNADGSTDSSFGSVLGINNAVNGIAVQPDGKVVIGGQFGTSGTPYYVTRLNPNGSRDSAFDANLGAGANGIVYAVTRGADGKIYLGGSFTKINNVTVPARLARLNDDGTIDQNFNAGGAGADATVYSLRLLADGKILVGGQFDFFNAALSYGLVKLDANGTVDAAFSTALRNDTKVLDIEIGTDGKIYVGGLLRVQIGSLIPSREIIRLNADGSHDTTFNYAGSTSNFRAIALQLNGDVVYGGTFEFIGAEQRTTLALLKPAGALDQNFTPVIGKNESANTIDVQPDGRILIGGRFAGVNDRASKNFARLNADGTFDTGFNVGKGFDNEVFAVAVQSDGKILVGGQFTLYNDVSRSRLVRLNQDGSLDASFVGQASNTIRQIQVLPNNQILISGVFDRVNNVNRSRIARLNHDGTLDATFNPESINGAINTFTVQADGKILIGGSFNSVNGASRLYFARLNADGTHDAAFDTGAGFTNTVEEIRIVADKILVAGQFSKYNNVAANFIVRLNSDGTRDASFNAGSGASSTVYTIAAQTDGRILVGGTFVSFNGISRNRLVRLNQDGSLDASFNIGTGANNYVNAVAVQTDGRILTGGDFDSFNNKASIGIARLSAGSTIRWTGAANANWSDAANWSNGVPTASDNVIVEAGTTNAPVLNGNLNVTSLEVKAGATLQINSGASLTAQGINNDGQINGGGTLNLAGVSMVNNGTISVAEVKTTTGGAKSLSGAGSFANNVFRIENGTQLRLDGDHAFESISISSQSNFNITSRTIRLRGAGQAIVGSLQTNFSTVIYEGTAPQNLSASDSLTYYNLVLNNPAGFLPPNTGNVSVVGTLNLQNGLLNMGTQTLTVGQNSNWLRTGGYVVGKMQKFYDQPESYTFPVGTANGYSPVTINVTSGTPIITAKATQNSHPFMNPAKSLQRFWTLQSNDTFSADLTFQYIDADVAGNELNYRVTTISGGDPQPLPNNCPAICVDAANNTATISGVTNSSDWSLSDVSSPTSAPANLGGRVRQSNNQPIGGVLLTAISQTGQSRTTTSDASGNYNFAEMTTGAAYTVTASLNGYNFAPEAQFVNHTGDRDDVDFVAAPANARRAINDFDGDGRTDIAVFRPAEGNWYIWQSGSNSLRVVNFGAASDQLVAADYDGDGKTDVAIFRAGSWYMRQSSGAGEIRADNFGQADDVLVPADYTGDGKADLAVFRSGVWFIKQSENGQMKTVNFGSPTDKAMPADYDGDGKADVAVYRSGVWYVLRSSDNQMQAVSFGAETDVPFAADYTGDGKADFAVFRSGIWFVKTNGAEFDSVEFGAASDTPLKGDFDGDGRADIAVFRGGTWHIQPSASAYRSMQFGLPTDRLLSSPHDKSRGY